MPLNMPQPTLFNRRFWEDELPARLVEAAVTHVPRTAPGEGGVRLRQVERHAAVFSSLGLTLGETSYIIRLLGR